MVTKPDKKPIPAEFFFDKRPLVEDVLELTSVVLKEDECGLKRYYNKEAQIDARNDIQDLEYRLEMHHLQDSADKESEKYYHVLEMTSIVLKEDCGE